MSLKTWLFKFKKLEKKKKLSRQDLVPQSAGLHCGALGFQLSPALALAHLPLRNSQLPFSKSHTSFTFKR